MGIHLDKLCKAIEVKNVRKPNLKVHQLNYAINELKIILRNLIKTSSSSQVENPQRI
jgi:ribosomal protein L29